MNDNEDALTPAQEAYLKGVKPGLFMTLQVHMTEDGEIQAGVIQVPIDLRIIEDFQAQMGKQLAEANMKLVIVKGQAFLAPIQESSLILPQKSGILI